MGNPSKMDDNENSEWWKEAVANAKSLSDLEHIFRSLWPSIFPKPIRNPLFDFPDVIIHASETSVKKHPSYHNAKTGDAESASILIDDTINSDAVDEIRNLLCGRKPIIVCAHAIEREGVNAIPEVFADKLSQKLGFIVDNGIIQINQVGHTGSDGFGRLARQPVFEGNVIPGQDYLMVDDFVGMGGTLANLRGYIESKGGKVIAATVLTGKQYSAKIALNHDTLQNLRDKHGRELENWWQERFGHAFDSLTQSEARYLLKTENADRIRKKIAAAEQG